MPEYEYDDTEVEGVSISDYDALVSKASAWGRISAELDRNGADECSAGDVCSLGFDLQVWLANCVPGTTAVDL